MRRRWRWLVALLSITTLLAGACGDDDDSGGSAAASSTPAADRLSGDVQVFAAASLTEAFTAMAKDFEAAHPGVEVTFNFAASSALAQQIIDGGPADVFVSADASNMAKVIDAGLANGPEVIARNRLALLVEKGNPAKVTGLADLARPGLVFVLCAPEVPCGKFGAAALAKAGVTATPASLEDNVKSVVSKVTLGEADAGIVYVTDVKAAAGQATGVPIDIADDPDLEAVYPIVRIDDDAAPEVAEAWIDYVRSDKGQATLARFGFLSP